MALRRLLPALLLPILILTACGSAPVAPSPTIPPIIVVPSFTPTIATTDTPTVTPTPVPLVPDFEHVVIVVLENKEFGTVIGNSKMPYFNQLAQKYTLLTQLYAVTHPSLPNYLAMIGGDTFGINFDCTKCNVNEPSLPDQIEASGRTWKTYQEDMPSPCFAGSDYNGYAMKHNPFIYFQPIRLDSTRCNRSIVPLTQLSTDIAAGALPNFLFITPNLCNDAHDCEVSVADGWLQKLMTQLQPALDATGKPYLIILTWDEGQGNHSCCGLPKLAGGRIATILISPQAKTEFQDDTAYSLYSILKTIETAWNLKLLRHAADEQTTLITAPWK